MFKILKFRIHLSNRAKATAHPLFLPFGLNGNTRAFTALIITAIAPNSELAAVCLVGTPCGARAGGNIETNVWGSEGVRATVAETRQPPPKSVSCKNSRLSPSRLSPKLTHDSPEQGYQHNHPHQTAMTASFKQFYTSRI